jgi:hypothetical protein
MALPLHKPGTFDADATAVPRVARRVLARLGGAREV